MGFLDYLNIGSWIIGDPSDKFDRTNVNDGIFQARQSITQALSKKNPLLESNSFSALVLWVSSPVLDTTPVIPLSYNPGFLENNYVQIPTTKIKIYFRVPVLHSNLPLPNSFHPEYKSTLSILKPEDQNELLISCHPSLYADFSEFSNIIPGDIIKIEFDDETYSSAKLVGLEEKGINNIEIKTDFTSSIVDIFDDAAETEILGSAANSSSLGHNQAKYYTEANRGPNEILNIVLHSTDGTSGPGRAQHTIHRFAEGPTLRFDWTNKETGKVIINPSCELVLKVDGKLPKTKKGVQTICHDKRKNVEIPVKTSIHYAVDQGGNIIQGVLDKDIASHAGGTMNRRSIGIEMNGRPADGPGEGLDGKYAKMYNDKIINATAKLVASLATKYNIPIVRVTGTQPGIIAHHNISNTRFDPGNNLGRTRINSAGEKIVTPPGNYWDWDDFLTRVKNYQATSV